MKFFRRHVLTIIALLIYWPAIFVSTHIPLTIPSLFLEFRISDKILHFVAYFTLVFLLWFTINPKAKATWKSPAVWWILFIVVWYGAIDEWLQAYVGRTPDIWDFTSDLIGSISALFLLSIVNFWTAALIIAGGGIFIFQNLIRTNHGELVILPASIILLFCYVILTSLWVRWIYHFTAVKIPERKWFLTVLSLPVIFLIATDLISLTIFKNFSILNTVFSLIGIVSVIFSVYFFPKVRRKIS